MSIQVLEKINFGNLGQAKSKKKILDRKLQEQEKIYGYIGMEAYSLYSQGRLDCQELDIYFKEMEALEQEIKELREEKEEADENSVCVCGCTLLPHQRFCPNCGKPVEKEAISCTCGNLIEKGMQFCPNCGKNVKGLEGETQKKDIKYKECICGARIAEGQFMCMECGRKVT